MLLLGAALAVGFGVWSARVVDEANRVREQLEGRHDLVRELQWTTRTLHTHHPHEAVVAEALDRIGELCDRVSDDPELVPRAEAARVAARALRVALETPGDRDAARVAVMQTVDGLMRAIWVETEALDAEMVDRWSAIHLLSLVGLGLAVLAWVFFGVASRRSLEVEEAYATLGTVLDEAHAARAAAQSASDAKSEFLATVSHEIRTPMTVILGRVELLRTTTLDVAQTGHLDVIDRAGDQLLQLISDVLDLSRIEAGALHLHLTDFNLDAVLDEIIVLFRAPAHAQGLQLRREGSRFGTVQGDAGRLRQVIVNLIGNALKFTVQGGISLRGTRTGEEVLLEVLDTGPGLPVGSEEALFNIFEQADSSSSRSHGGAGLGLAISRRLVEAMGGTISAKNRPARGAHFSVRVALPVVSEAAISEDLEVDMPPPEEEPGPRILLVDDNADTREVLGLLLQSLGCRVSRAASGAEAIDRAHADAFDLIFMDCDMPGIDGLSTTSSLRRSDGPCARAAIVGLSGYATEDAKERALESGMDDYLAKPIRIGGLKAAIDKWTGDEGSFPPGAL